MYLLSINIKNKQYMYVGLYILSAVITLFCLSYADVKAKSSLNRTGFNSPDMILYNAVILTMEPRNPIQKAIAIKGEKIMAGSDDDSILSLASNSTRVFNMQKYTIMPGLVDAHSHWFNAGNSGLDESQQLLLKMTSPLLAICLLRHMSLITCIDMSLTFRSGPVFI